MGGFYTEESFLQIVMVTGIIGGGAAWLAGGAIARTWRAISHVVAYMLLLGAGVRFVHFALFEGSLLSLASYICDTAYLMLAGTLAWQITRTNQMVRQYVWLYKRTSPLSWGPRNQAAADDVKSKTS